MFRVNNKASGLIYYKLKVNDEARETILHALCSKPTIKLVEQGVLCSKSTILFVKLCVYVQKQQNNKASGAMCCLLKFDKYSCQYN